MKSKLKNVFILMLKILPRYFYETRFGQTPIYFKYFLWQKILGFNRGAYWPVHFSSKISYPKNVYCGIETCPGYMPGCYIQAKGKIYIGNYTQIAANVGMITANHSVYNNRLHESPAQITVGEYCWIGMNSILLPGVTLGDFTIVGAGSVVTKSFSEGFCVIAGNPARLIKRLDPEKCVRERSQFEYHGYISAIKFDKFRREELTI